MSVEEQVQAAFDRINRELGGVDVLVNNAGIFLNAGLLEENCDSQLNAIIQTNLMGVIWCTRRAFKSMVERDNESYIVNISSVAGHNVISNLPDQKPFPGAYFASKHALTALNRAIGQELVFYQKPKIRITNISPGVVNTDIFRTGGFGNSFDAAPHLTPEDVSNAMLYLLSTPPHVHTRDMIMESVGTSFY